MNEPILVTGAAGFIGFHVTRKLLSQGRRVVGVDSLTPYYDPSLKEARRAERYATDGIYVSGGQRGLNLKIKPGDLMALTGGTLFDAKE